MQAIFNHGTFHYNTSATLKAAHLDVHNHPAYWYKNWGTLYTPGGSSIVCSMSNLTSRVRKLYPTTMSQNIRRANSTCVLWVGCIMSSLVKSSVPAYIVQVNNVFSSLLSQIKLKLIGACCCITLNDLQPDCKSWAQKRLLNCNHVPLYKITVR